MPKHTRFSYVNPRVSPYCTVFPTYHRHASHQAPLPLSVPPDLTDIESQLGWVARTCRVDEEDVAAVVEDVQLPGGRSKQQLVCKLCPGPPGRDISSKAQLRHNKTKYHLDRVSEKHFIDRGTLGQNRIVCSICGSSYSRGDSFTRHIVQGTCERNVARRAEAAKNRNAAPAMELGVANTENIPPVPEVPAPYYAEAPMYPPAAPVAGPSSGPAYVAAFPHEATWEHQPPTYFDSSPYAHSQWVPAAPEPLSSWDLGYSQVYNTVPVLPQVPPIPQLYPLPPPFAGFDEPQPQYPSYEEQAAYLHPAQQPVAPTLTPGNDDYELLVRLLVPLIEDVLAGMSAEPVSASDCECLARLSVPFILDQLAGIMSAEPVGVGFAQPQGFARL